jgi:integrase
MASIRKRTWRTQKGELRTGWTFDYFDSNGERQRRQFDSRREADAFRVTTEGQLKSGTYRADASKVTVLEVAHAFIEHCRGRMERGERMTRHNFEVYEGHIRNYICPDRERYLKTRRFHKRRFFEEGIAATRLGQLTARGVGDFRDRLRKHGLSVITTRKVLATLKVMLEYAVEQDFIAVNVARRVRVIGRRDERRKKIIPPSKEAMRLILSVVDPDMRIRLIVAATTGLRAGEFHALRWKHIDFEHAEVSVETRVDAYGDEDVTKTEAGLRTVPLSKSVVVALQEWRNRSKFRKAGDLVFPNKRGWYENHDNMVKRHFDPLFDRLAALHSEHPKTYPEPPKRFNWHALRHFAISCWIEAGLAPKTVQTFAGHSTLAVTMDIYGHLFKSDDHKAAMDAIGKEVSAVRPLALPKPDKEKAPQP